MKIYIEKELIFELSELQRNIIAHFIPKDQIDQEMKSLFLWWATSYCQQNIEKLKREWLPILMHRMKAIPCDQDELVKVILSQPDYQDKSAQDAEAAAISANSVTER